MGERLSPTAEALVVSRVRGLKGVCRAPGDKSISHRAAMIGAIAEGETLIRGFAPGRDVERTLDCLRRLGVEIEWGPDPETVLVRGTGLCGSGPGFRAPEGGLDCGNSGTTARMMAGLVAGQPIEVVFSGDESLSRRPMERVAEPLRRMGAEVVTSEEGTLPMTVKGGALTGISHESPIASAQVKSSVLFAALNARGATEYREPIRSRDHTERMIKTFGGSIQTSSSGGGRGEYTVRLEPGSVLVGREVDVPGDISSALFLVVAVLLLPRSDVILEEVGLNPGRREALHVLSRMGANIEVSDRRTAGGEQRGRIRVRHSRLKGTSVSGKSVSWLIDEIPILAVAAAFAEGESYFKNAAELRKKESDRIAAIIHNLKVLGLEVGEYPDGFILRGKRTHDGGTFDSFGDHRIALAFHVAALACHGESVIRGYDAADVSWPAFGQMIEALRIQ